MFRYRPSDRVAIAVIALAVAVSAHSRADAATIAATCPEFAAQALYAVGNLPNSVAIADVNGDGKPDLAAANLGSSNVSILLGNGNGTFGAAVHYGAGTNPSSVAIADVNADAKPDLVVANQGSNNVSVLLGNGNGTFAAAVSYGVGSAPSSLAIADVNGDGRPDLAVANMNTLNVSVLLGNGNGTFATAVSFAVGAQPFAVAIGDVNGDAKPDLAVANPYSNNVSILLGNGNGTFAAAVNYAAGTTPYSVALADVNADGKLDLAVANNGSNDISILIGNGNGTFAAAVNYSAGGQAASVAIGDMNGDGKPDLAITNGGMSILLGNGNGTFGAGINYATGTFARSAALSDLNGDGKLDFAAANYNADTVSVGMGKGNGTFVGPAANYALGSASFSLAMGDVNGDGKLDLAVANYNVRNLSILLGNASGTFGAAVNYGTADGDTPYFVTMGDVNGDGKLDLAVTYSFSAMVSILLGNGNGTFALPVTYSTSGQGGSAAAAIGDVSGDGKPDLLVGLGDGVAVRLGNGNGTFGAAIKYGFAGVGQGAASIAIGDLNGDGKPDLAVATSGSNTVSILLGNGNGTFGLAVNYGAGSNPMGVAIGDLNGDGNADLAVASSGSASVSILLGDGTGTFFGGATNYATGPGSNSVVIVDVNGDGKLDLAVANNLSSTVSILLGNGSGTVAPAVNYSVGAGPYSVTSGDVNGDGRPDLAFANSASTSVSILLNTSCTTFPSVTVDRTSLAFSAVSNGAAFSSKTAAQAVRITQAGTGPVTWTATSTRPWLIVSPTSGSGSATINVSVQFASGLAATQAGNITITFTGAGNTAGPINVTLNTLATSSALAPAGNMDTPLDGTTGVAGSIPVTGWAIDDVGIARVSICRDGVVGEAVPAHPLCNGLTQIYIGDGLFLDGARPDIQALYPNAPLNTRAGWGYLMLTNFLPSGGNGTFALYAYATDVDGHTSQLGPPKMITCSNATSIAPFGSIDSPGQGEVIGGSVYNNFGWALSPGARRADVPGGGSTQVFVDSTNLGTPSGWVARSDLQGLFPKAQYDGVDNALAVMAIDTTTLSNGLHTIAWIVTGNSGGTSGIGSRYFTVSNGSGLLLGSSRASMAVSSSGVTAVEVDAAPADASAIRGRRGFDLNAPLAIYEFRGQRVTVQSEELDRVELFLGVDGQYQYTGSLRTAAGAAPLPVGSSLDATTGVFGWMPGAGFVGNYDFVFVQWSGGRAVARREVRIVLNPKTSNRLGPQVVIDAPAARSSGGPIVVGRAFFLAGWAADLDSLVDGGVDTVHVWAYPVNEAGQREDPTFLGPAIFGNARPDVATVYGDRFKESGYGMIVQTLAPGTYDIAVFAYSTVSHGFAPAKVVRVTVR